ncbi:protein MULTIPOLAR SPINDLE 1 isoform X2 [Phalaenopsis equestris]|uniref:protein MULTIPOLAR SPINDLE 1 isoform X2 n=1 Tax=Phalaenopsis equestris TaxID=78828 RepID=UPI0009E5F9DB|nr:protein MULTIPOLAR SPINDLE 1 isoform X2 [Phalaenopsis equestris]
MASPPIWMTDPNSLKIAIAISLFRLKNLHPQASSSAESDAQRWKKKAKERKLEILKLREEIKLLEDGRESEVVPEIASCRCHFFDGCGDFKVDGRDHWINEVLRRRFVRLVRWKGWKKNVDGGSVRRRLFSDIDDENEIERLSTSIDFLVQFADGISVKGRSDSSFSAIFHQAVNFILEPSVGNSDVQSLVQHLLRKLGTIAFVGQHAMLLISQKISAAAERMLFMDPFDEAFPNMHCSIFLMIQLMEFLVSDNFQIWTNDEDFDYHLLEEWVRSILQTQKGLKLLESRNVLYTLYMERLVGELVKLVGSLVSHGKFDSELLAGLLRWNPP